MKTPNMITLWWKKTKRFYKYRFIAILTAFSTKGLIEYKVQNSVLNFF